MRLHHSHTQTSICASNTAALWWHVPAQPPIAWRNLSLKHSRALTQTHSLSSLKEKNYILLLSLTYPSPFLSPHTTRFTSFLSPRLLSSHLSSWAMQPPRTNTVAFLQSPEEPLQTTACPCQCSQVMRCKNMPPCHFVYNLFPQDQNNSISKSYT